MLVMINDFIGNIKLDKIDTYMLDKMYNKIRKGNKVKESSPKSMAHYYNLVGLMFKQVKKWKLIGNNPNEDAVIPKLEIKDVFTMQTN